MWLYRNREFIKPSGVTKKSSMFIDKDFQVKYTLLVLGAASVGMLMVLFPVYYFLNQNYQIFLELAYEHAPKLLSHLEKERQWMNTLLTTVSISLLVFFFVLGIKMTAKIVGPLKVLRNHLKHISRGHWSMDPIRVREDDEFQDIIEAYNYFFSSFKTNAKKDLELIKSFAVDKTNRDAYYAWQAMIEQKSIQLDILDNTFFEQPISLNAASGAESLASHRAS